MSEEPLAHKNHTLSPPSNAEYDRIYATVSDTAQGRRFLEEYARRCRPDTEASLAAIERMQAAMRAGGTRERLQLLSEIAELAQAITRARAEIMAIKPPGGGPLETTGELDSIVQTTENATSRILAAAEHMQETARALRESGAEKTLCDRLDAQATEIYTACSFQDLTGQRTRKVIQVLRYLEERINAMVGAQDNAPAGAPAADDLPAANLAQADVDAVMQPEAHAEKERQDATLEDISRFMLALEPLMALHQEAAENSAEDGQAYPASAARAEDVRPELSVAEAVAAEADETRVMAEWAVEPVAPKRAKPAAATEAASVEWVVEDPAAPRPESEPAWMILQRLENELDAEAESEPASAAEAPPQAGQRTAMLPPAELNFPANRKAADPLDELQAALETAEIKLMQPEDSAAPPAEAAPAEAPPPAPEPVESPAAVAIETPVATAPVPAEDATVVKDSDTDEFLFEPETPHQDSGSPDLRARPEPEPPARPPEDEAPKPAPRAPYDPLAPLRAMSDEEKIALFS